MMTILKNPKAVVECNHRQGLSTLNLKFTYKCKRMEARFGGKGGGGGGPLWSPSNTKFLFYFAEAKCMPNSVAYFLYLKARK